MEGVLAGVKRVDTTVSGPMAHKYATLPRVVANLQPADVGRIFACSDDPMAFLPQWGLHVTEFCLGYCNNLPHKRTDGAPALLLPIPNAAALAHGSMYGSTPPASNTTASTSASASTSADKDKDKDTTGKRKRATNPVTNPVADPPPRMTKRKKLDTLVGASVGISIDTPVDTAAHMHLETGEAHAIVAPLDDENNVGHKREGDGGKKVPAPRKRVCSPAQTRSTEPTIKTRSYQHKRPRR